MSHLSIHIARFIDWFYVGPIKKILPKQTFRYAVCGGFTMVVGWILYDFLYNKLFDAQNLDLGFIVISPHVATLGACFPVTFTLGFLLNKHVAFKKATTRTQQQLVRYLLSVSGSLVLNYLLIKLFVEICHLYPTLGQIISTLLITVYSYLMQKYFTFKGSHID